MGADNDSSSDYSFYGIKLGETIKNKEADLGIAICGTGIGISIAANKVKGVLCAKISNKEEAKLAKEHNHANIIAFSGATSPKKALTMIEEFLKAKPLEEEKYNRRIDEIKKYENDC